jgi:adenylate kinase family enzyme
MNTLEKFKIMKKTIVLIGPHGSGKTTIGKMLSKIYEWPFDYEIGKKLRKEIIDINPDYHAMAEQEKFDREVFSLEKKRDLESSHNRIVETWHPGNCAYAMLRSREVARHIYEEAREHLFQYYGKIIIQPLEINEDTILKRLSESGPNKKDLSEFFLRVYEKSILLASKLNLKLLNPINTSQTSIKDTINRVIYNLNNF